MPSKTITLPSLPSKIKHSLQCHQVIISGSLVAIAVLLPLNGVTGPTRHTQAKGRQEAVARVGLEAIRRARQGPGAARRSSPGVWGCVARHHRREARPLFPSGAGSPPSSPRPAPPSARAPGPAASFALPLRRLATAMDVDAGPALAAAVDLDAGASSLWQNRLNYPDSSA